MRWPAVRKRTSRQRHPPSPSASLPAPVSPIIEPESDLARTPGLRGARAAYLTGRAMRTTEWYKSK